MLELHFKDKTLHPVLLMCNEFVLEGTFTKFFDYNSDTDEIDTICYYATDSILAIIYKKEKVK